MASARAPTTPQGASARPGTELIDVRVDGLAVGGDAVGRQEGGTADGRATFVALAAPGEKVKARVLRRRARVAWAELISIEQPSPDRVTPPCRFFGECGGCQWQHVDLRAQRAAKRAIVARALSVSQSDVELIAPAGDGLGYRDRAHLMVGPRGQIGFHARRSHQVVGHDRCLLLSPVLETALREIRASGHRLGAGTEIALQAGREGVHVALRRASLNPTGRGGPDARGASLTEATATSLFESWRGAGVVGLQVTSAGGGNEPDVYLGARDVDISESPPGQGAEGPGPIDAPLRIPAGAFAQVGRAANRALVAAVLRGVGADPGVVLELYAGSGNLTRGLVRCASRVLACDANRDALQRGQRNVGAAAWSRHPPASVEADTVVADPPREGLDAENLGAAIQARRRIVYVSCDPQTLGRDVKRLAQAGFALVGAVALDLMPHTFHVEIVATFEKR